MFIVFWRKLVGDVTVSILVKCDSGLHVYSFLLPRPTVCTMPMCHGRGSVDYHGTKVWQPRQIRTELTTELVSDALDMAAVFRLHSNSLLGVEVNGLPRRHQPYRLGIPEAGPRRSVLAKLLCANFFVHTGMPEFTFAAQHAMSLEDRLVKVRDSPKGHNQYQV